MSEKIVSSKAVLAAAMSVVVVALSIVSGQSVPGEKWRQTMTVQVAGMSMPMGTHEVCAPAGKPESLLQPDKNCVATNVTVTGNTTTAHISCTGKDAMEGTIEATVQGERMTAKIRAKTGDGDEIAMTMDSQKLGACQAVDTAALAAKSVPQARPAMAAAPSACGMYAAALKKGPQVAAAMAKFFLEGECATKPANADFCASLQTRAGFSAFQQTEAANKGVTEKSVVACNLGTGAAGVEALKTKLVAGAETDGDGDFLIANSPARARQLVRSECVAKGEMWAGKTAKWDRFCDSNFAAEVRNGK